MNEVALSSAASLSGASGRYASAIFDLAKSSGSLDTVASEFDGLRAVLDDSPDLAGVIASPAYSREQQGAVMAQVGERMGASDLTRKFIGLMAQKGRLALLPDAMKGFAGLVAAERNEQTAEVVSAKPLSDAQREALRHNLATAFQKDVKIDAQVDPSLLGGLIVRIGSKMVDASLRSKLERLERAMKAN